MPKRTSARSGPPPAPSKRARSRASPDDTEDDDDDNRDDRDAEQQEGGASGDAPLDETSLDELDKLRSHSTRYKVRIFEVKVAAMLPWACTDLTQPGGAAGQNSKLEVPENYYQRNSKEGWTEAQKSKYLTTIFAGQAATPFVINLKRKHARVIDGGHRLDALLSFYRNEVGMEVGQRRVLYRQLPEDDREHFDDQTLQILEYKNIPLKDEINVYMVLNSALPFSIGEKLAANRGVNRLVLAATHLLRSPLARPLLDEARLALLGEPSRRSNDVAVACFCAYNLHFRDAASPLAGSMRDEFCDAVCRGRAFLLDQEAPDDAPLRPPDADAVADVAAKLRAALALYRAATGGDGKKAACDRTGQTRFRRMLVCLAAAAAIPHAEPARFRAFLEQQAGSSDGLRVLGDKSQLDPAAVAAIRDAYDAHVRGGRA